MTAVFLFGIMQESLFAQGCVTSPRPTIQISRACSVSTATPPSPPLPAMPTARWRARREAYENPIGKTRENTSLFPL